MPEANIPAATEEYSEASKAAMEAAMARSEHGLGETERPAEEEKPAVPDWCPEKFARYADDGSFDTNASAVAMAQAHGELEKRFHQERQQPAEEKPEAAEENPAPEVNEPPVGDEFWRGLTEQYNTEGQLSEENLTILRDMGIPDYLVNDFIEGQKARGNQYEQTVTSVLGENGQVLYDALIDWAGQGSNMTEAEAKVFNDAIQSGDVTRAQIAIRDLKNQYVAQEGSLDGLLLDGNAGGGNATSATPFRSRAEMSEAINDRRYARDPAYRADVARRLAVTDF